MTIIPKFFDGRLTDNDTYYLSGIITVGTVKEGGPSLRLISANPDSDADYCKLTVQAFGRCIRVILPPIIRPHKVKQKAKYWTEEDIKRQGRDWHYKYFTRQYGFSFWDDSVILDYGMQSGDSSDNPKTTCLSLPWKRMRFVRHTVYDLEGQVYLQSVDYKRQAKGISRHETATIPKAEFKLVDLSDNTEVTATLVLEEREWRRGTGLFRFLSYFYKPLVSRSFDVEFSAEVGDRKGDWKGGVTGMSVKALPGELHVDGIKRLCQEGVNQGRRDRALLRLL